jgi:ABC-2 type transport system ATP-binding protein
MLKLVREIRDTGEVHVVVSSHLLRDVEECCEEVLILKQGRIAYTCNLEEERRANRKFLELEVRGDAEGFLAALRARGVESGADGKRRIKAVLPPDLPILDLYRIAEERKVEIRHLDYKKDSLQDIFLKAMEGGANGGL